MMAASNIHYEIGEKTRGIAPGGIGAIHLLAQKIGLVRDIDEGLHLLELERPPRYTIKTAPRQARERHKQQDVWQQEFRTLILLGEEVAELSYRPVPARRRIA